MSRRLSKTSIAAAVASAVCVATLWQSSSQAQLRGIKCYGITKAGQNDCAHAAGHHFCAGEALVDYDGGDWKLVRNAGECENAGGSVKPFEGANPKAPKS